MGATAGCTEMTTGLLRMLDKEEESMLDVLQTSDDVFVTSLHDKVNMTAKMRSFLPYIKKLVLSHPQQPTRARTI